MQFPTIYRHAGLSRLRTLPIRELRTTTVINAPADTEHVRRRRLFREDLHKKRVEFQKEMIEQQTMNTEKASKDAVSGADIREARAARKREKSAAKQPAHLARLSAIQEEKMKRKAFKYNEWQRKQQELVQMRQAKLNMLIEASENWITEENLQQNVEQVIDAFFIVTDEDVTKEMPSRP